MSRAVLTSAMFVRLGISVLACISLPAFVQVVSPFAADAPRPAPIRAQVASSAGANPFGSLIIEDGTKPVAVSANVRDFERLRSDYFGRMMPVDKALPAEPETDSAGEWPRAPEPAATPLPVGCEALGGVASHLDQVAGRCLS